MQTCAYQVCHIVSELYPFSKVGGLADVAGSLPIALEKEGVPSILFSPLYSQVRSQASATWEKITLPLSEGSLQNIGLLRAHPEITFWRTRLPHTQNVHVYFVEHEGYYNRPSIYSPPGTPYPDDLERFAFLCLAALEALKTLAFHESAPTVLHLHDWHTVPTLLYLKTRYADLRQPSRPKKPLLGTLLTIHNFSYQGIFDFRRLGPLGLTPFLSPLYLDLEFYGRMNLLKAGLYQADRVVVASRSYLEEMKTPEFGYGLEGVVREQAPGKMMGIVNGIDTKSWDPANDPWVPFPYSARDLSGKALCKEAFEKYVGWEVGRRQSTALPLFSFIGRFVEQKGIDLLLQSLSNLLLRPLRLAFLGSGEERYEKALREAAQRTPGRLWYENAFREDLAHLLYAASDFLLMPSRFEPCGLNQLYALRYGTLPVAHATGGLKDTLIDVAASPLSVPPVSPAPPLSDSLTPRLFDLSTSRLLNSSLSRRPTADGQLSPSQLTRGTAFLFFTFTPQALLHAVDRALAVYQNQTDYLPLCYRAMSQDWSWTQSAREYIHLYQTLLPSLH